MASQAKQPKVGFFDTQRGRALLENLTAYLFIAPAGFIIFTFGLFPVAFAFFVSLHRWRRFPGDYRGLDEYVDAIGNFAYVGFFWIALGLLLFAGFRAYRLWKESRDESEPRALLALVPGALQAFGLFAFINWFFILLVPVLNVPQRLRGVERTGSIFVQEFFNSFRFENVLAAADIMWIGVIAAIVSALLFLSLFRFKRNDHYLFVASTIFVALVAGVLIMQLTLSEIDTAISEARAEGENLPIWTQIVMISAGFGLLGIGYKLWQRVPYALQERQFWLQAVAVVVLVIGAVLLIVELPRALSEADDDIMNGFSVTIMYALFSVPLQLAIGLALAVLLFQNIKGKSFFRVIYFMPYITPFVATSVIFALLFSHRSGSPANQLLANLGIETQAWLLEPDGIFQILFGDGVPDALAGPGLALMVIILYNVWIYAGYSTVIFLAGLGNIPRDFYEAARIDGASSWSQFRFITLPLLSPTTFFLTLIATIGTFQAFTQIFLMRRPGAYEAVDTINIYIFQEIRDTNPDYAYGSAMAFVLFAVILMLTLVQNRLVGRRVFYG